MMKRLMLACITAFISMAAAAQLLTWSPAFPTETDNITITVDASKGNQGLMNFSGNVYVHVGAITNLSTGPSNWLHVPFTWGSSEAAAQATSAGPNKWRFTINNPRTFFNLAANEQLQHIAILFRQGGCTNCQAQRNADGSDMYIPIYNANHTVRIDVPASQPKFLPEPETQNWVVGTNFTIKAFSNKYGAMKLYHNGTEVASTTNTDSIIGNSTVIAIGTQQLIAESNDGSTTRYDTLNIFVSPASSPVAALPAGMRDGINYEPGDTSVILVLRAPGKTKASVIGEFNNWTQDVNYIMNKTPDGKFFWLRIRSLTPGTEYAYQYLVDDVIRIADPYTEKVLDPFNDQYITAATYPNLKPYPAGQSGIVSVLQTAKPSYNWTVTNFNRPDKRGLVIYEMLLRDFVAAHDWKTVMDSLDYLKTLGINAIQIMPFNEFEGNLSWGYNPSFYVAPDKYYGTEHSLKAFIDSCHSKGIAVIMDIALNHSFGQSPMVQLYWDATNSRPAANNPWYNPVPKHAFNVGYDMNHVSPDTKYFTSRVVEHWLQQYKIDGFRFDLSKGFTQKQTCDNNGNNCDVGQMGAYDAQRVGIWKAYFDTTQLKAPGSYVILEHFADNQEEIELSNYGMMLWGNHNHQFSQASMG
ncbi:MAG TPA: alpha-amylase family glycosyl hydrolase, partial [Flavisolibacter sp.]